MKTKFFLCLTAVTLSCSTAFSQLASSEVSMTEEIISTTENPAAPPPAAKKEVAIQLRNNCEHTIAVYSGDKKEVFSGKGKLLGGLSNNQLFLMEGDAICIMNDPKTIQACSMVKDGVTKVTINASGNGFVK